MTPGDFEVYNMNLQSVTRNATGYMILCAVAVAQSNPYANGQIPPPAKPASQVRVTQGPELESYRDGLAIISWTSNNPGGTDEHWGVVHYGTSPDNLDQTAKSHIRLNQNHATTVFRVRVDGLQPDTTYYYTVDSIQAGGKSDGVKCAVSRFTTSSDPQHVPPAAAGKKGQ